MSDGKLSRTYRESFDDFFKAFCADPANQGVVPSPALAIKFAEYLDSFQELSPEFKLIAMQKSREIDGDVLLAQHEKLVELIGTEEATAIVKTAIEKHRHTVLQKVEASEVVQQIESNDGHTADHQS